MQSSGVFANNLNFLMCIVLTFRLRNVQYFAMGFLLLIVVCLVMIFFFHFCGFTQAGELLIH